MEFEKLIKYIKHKEYDFKNVNFYYTADNPIEYLQLIVYQYFKRIYYSYIENKENAKIDWKSTEYNDFLQHLFFSGRKLRDLFSRYPLSEVIENYFSDDLNICKNFSSICSEMDFTKEMALQEKSNIISILNGNPRPLSISYVKNMDDYTLDQIIELLEVSSPLPIPIPIKIQCELSTENLHQKFFAGCSLTNKEIITRLELKILAISYKLTGSEIFYFLRSLNDFTQPQNYQLAKKVNNSISNQFKTKNKFEKEVLETIQGNYGKGIILNTINFDGKVLESEFTDFQSFHICKGLKNQTVLFNKYGKSRISNKDRYEAHYLAMKTLKNSGRAMVGSMLCLPNLPFRTDNFSVFFRILDRLLIEGNKNPKIILRYNNSHRDEDVLFSFGEVNNIRFSNIISVFNKSTRCKIMSISRGGIVIPEDNLVPGEKNKNVTPIIEFFYQEVEKFADVVD